MVAREEWVRGGGGAAHLFLLRRVTSRLISFHFLSLHPGVSIPLGVAGVFVRVRRFVYRPPSPPGEYSRDRARGKRTSSLSRPDRNSPRRFSSPVEPSTLLNGSVATGTPRKWEREVIKDSPHLILPSAIHRSSRA